MLLPLIFTTSCKKKLYYPQQQNEDIIEIKTEFGTMYMWLYKSTKQHRENFLTLAKNQYYDSTTFHRVVVNFVIQGGDPNSKDADKTNDGTGGPGYTIPAEFNDSITHVYGAVGAARDNNPQKASNGSQFYIVTNLPGAHFLDKNYTVFGIIFNGMDVAVAISTKAKDSKDRPLNDIKMDVNVVQFTPEYLKDNFGFNIPKY